MCSLFGWLDYKHVIPQKTLHKLTQALANAAEERGTDAAGISYIKDGKVTIFKRPKAAHKIHFDIPVGTAAVMGHTRMTTQGNEKHNYNNHPFPGHTGDMDFALAHNGMLHNDEKLRKEQNLPDTHIETDSYIAVQLIEQKNKLDFDSLKYMAESVHGSFCFSVLDEMGKLYIVKGSNPISIAHFESLGLYVYASTDSILNKALKKVGLQKSKFLPIVTVDGDMISIDSNGNVDTADFKPYISSSFGKYNYSGWYDLFDDFDTRSYSLHEQMLVELSHCYGVDEEDINLLLEYGYSADEIEEMLMDYDELSEVLNAIKGIDDDNYYDLLCDGVICGTGL